MVHLTDRHIKAHQGAIAEDMRRSRARSSVIRPRSIRTFLAGALVIAGVRLMPGSETLIRNRVLVFPDHRDDTDRELRPAA